MASLGRGKSRKRAENSVNVEEDVILHQHTADHGHYDPTEEGAEDIMDVGNVVGHELGEAHHHEETDADAMPITDEEPPMQERPKKITAYQLFMKHTRKQFTIDNPELTFGQISTKLSQIWNGMTSEDKNPYVQQAQAEKARWGFESEEDELEDTGPKKRGRKRKSRKWTKDPKAPKKAATPYILFVKSLRPELIEQFNNSPTEILKEISSRWRKLTPEEKQPYEVESAKDKERYEQEKKIYLENRPPEANLKRPKRVETHREKEGSRIIKVRLVGEDMFDMITIYNSMTLKQLFKKIQQKRSDNRPITSLVQLPNVRIRDQADLNSVGTDDQLEFTFADYPASFILERIRNHETLFASVALMSSQELYPLVKAVSLSKKPKYHDILALCKFLRENHMRDYRDLVAIHGHSLLLSYQSSLGNEAFALAEQVALAALDIHRLDIAESCISILENKFGNSSSRVIRLQAIKKEFEGSNTDAISLYQSLLEKDPSDGLTLKRQISLAKETGSRDVVIRLLNEFLAIFQSDVEAWLELADLYLESHLFQFAAYCLEELILLQPQNYHFYVKYGEILYTIGNLDNFLLAGKQFSFSLELSSINNNRAWWGLALSANAIIASKQVSPKDFKTYSDIYQLAASQLGILYSESSKSHLVAKTLEQLKSPAPKQVPTTSSISTIPTKQLKVGSKQSTADSLRFGDLKLRSIFYVRGKIRSFRIGFLELKHYNMIEDLIHGPKNSAERLEKIPNGATSSVSRKSRKMINMAKIQAQSPKAESHMFDNVNVYFTGYTDQVSINQLRNLVYKYGGKTTYMFSASKTTHVVCTSLCASKVSMISNCRRKIYVVHPNWIMESAKQKKLANEYDFEVVPVSKFYPKILKSNPKNSAADLGSHSNANESINSVTSNDLFGSGESKSPTPSPSGTGQDIMAQSETIAKVKDDSNQCKPTNHPLMQYRRSSKLSSLYTKAAAIKFPTPSGINSHYKIESNSFGNPTSMGVKQRKLESYLKKADFLSNLPKAQTNLCKKSSIRGLLRGNGQ